MDAHELLEASESVGIKITLRGEDGLSARGPMSASAKALIQEHKPELVKLLNGPSRSRLRDARAWLTSFDMTRRIGKPIQPEPEAEFLRGYLSSGNEAPDWREWHAAWRRAVAEGGMM